MGLEAQELNKKRLMLKRMGIVVIIPAALTTTHTIKFIAFSIDFGMSDKEEGFI